ncbi:MAG: hypothetical protein BGO39_03550 [Chloroflexi bacterium 54-19]|nr:MAG: hypothetical protein BGO39_03550 [Chloroflexi bacterium 54-19]
MQLQKNDQAFRNPSIFHIDPKSINLDRALLNLFILMKYDGYRPISRKRPSLTVENLFERFTTLSSLVNGFEENQGIASKWLESDLVDMVNRGIPGKESVVALRPLHLDSYKLRNPIKIRDYNTSDQIYSMLLYGNKEVLDSLKEFLGKGLTNIDQTDSNYDDNNIRELDLITLTIIRLVEGSDLIDQKGRTNQSEIRFPLLLDQAQLMCDDLKRLLVYKDLMPRHILIEYIKVMMGIHLALYLFRLANELPTWVRNKNAPEPTPYDKTSYFSPLELIMDMGSNPNSKMAQISAANTARHYDSMNDFIRAVFAVNVLVPFAKTMGVFSQSTLKNGEPSIQQLIGLLANQPFTFEGYFLSKVNGLFADEPFDHVEKPEIVAIKNMEISFYDKYVELITSARSKFHKKYLSELLEATTQKNSEEGMVVQPQGSRKPRRFHIGSKLLEILVQIAVLEETGEGNYRTKVIRINEFIEWLRQRYGFVINGMDSSYNQQAEITDSEAFRQNIQALKDRLREIGFYTDLSDAYNSQTIKPRYQID